MRVKLSDVAMTAVSSIWRRSESTLVKQHEVVQAKDLIE
jgi:hypothetical protein